MGSNPPGSLDTLSEPVPEGVPECKRRRRAPESPKGAAPLGEDPEFDASQPDWWKPQPHATLDPSEYQDRPAAPLARALSCVLCRELLKEAMTCPDCGHTYCYDCIEARVEIGGKSNVCPAPGCCVLLGANPFDHHRILYDSLLDSLVQKIFPRPELDAALTARRADREEATRQARAAVNGPGGGSTHDSGPGRGHGTRRGLGSPGAAHRETTGPPTGRPRGRPPGDHGGRPPGDHGAAHRETTGAAHRETTGAAHRETTGAAHRETTGPPTGRPRGRPPGDHARTATRASSGGGACRNGGGGAGRTDGNDSDSRESDDGRRRTPGAAQQASRRRL